MTAISRDEAEEILGVCRYEAKRFSRRSKLLEPDDAAQEAAVAILVARRRAAARLAGPLMRVVARRRIINATRDELVRKRQAAGARGARGTFRIMLESPGFLAVEHRDEADAEPTLAHNPWPAWERAYAAQQLSVKRCGAMAESWDRPRPGTSRQAEHGRLRRAAAWYKKNRLPFDCF